MHSLVALTGAHPFWVPAQSLLQSLLTEFLPASNSENLGPFGLIKVSVITMET